MLKDKKETKSNWKYFRDCLKLTADEDERLSSAYGGYIPMTIRLLEKIF